MLHCFSCLFVLPLFVLFCGSTPFLEARAGFLAEVGSPSRLFKFLAEVGRTGRPSPPLGRVIPRGALLARRVGLSGILTAYSSSHRVTETPRAFYLGRGRFPLPPHSGPFSHALVFCFPPQGFFLARDGPWGPEWIARRYLIQCRIQSAAPRIPRNSLRNPGYIHTPPHSCDFW